MPMKGYKTWIAVAGMVALGIVDILKNEELGLITSRAMTDLESLMRLCGPILMPGGMLIVFLGSQWKNELKKSENTKKYFNR